MRCFTSWAVDERLTRCDNPALILLLQGFFFLIIHIVLPPAYSVLA